MPAVVIAVAAAVGATAAAASSIVSGVQGKKANDVSQQQADIAQSSHDLNTEQFNLDKETKKLDLQGQIRGIDSEILGLQGQMLANTTNIQEAEADIASYDKWLANYSSQYAQEVQSKQAQTDALMASGRESYDNFLNAIGYADAAAGASGRVGAGTSQAHTTSMIDRKLVDYVGADRTLDATGGLFGSQLTAANMEMDQMKIDLEFQRQQMVSNRELAQASIGNWQTANTTFQDSITNSTTAKTDLEKFIQDNFS